MIEILSKVVSLALVCDKFLQTPLKFYFTLEKKFKLLATCHGLVGAPQLHIP